MTARHMTETERMQRHETLMRDLTLQQIRSVDDWVQTMRVLGCSKDDIAERLLFLQQSVISRRQEYL